MDLKNNSSGGMEREQHHENRFGAGLLAGSPGAFVLASAIGPRIPLSPPDAGGAGGDGGAGGESGAGGEGGDDNGGGGDGGQGGGDQKPVRPDFIPETFWDAEKGFKADDFNALVARDAENSARLAQVPDAADKYEAKLPHDFKLPDGVELADGESALDANDPRIAAARDFAHANQMSQAQFEGMLAMGVSMDLAEQSRLNEAVKAQKELLGAKGEERIGAVKTWIGAKLPADQAEALTGMMFTAKTVEAFEALMRLNRGAVPGNPGAGRDAAKPDISDEDWAKMTDAQRIDYARQHSKK